MTMSLVNYTIEQVKHEWAKYLNTVVVHESSKMYDLWKGSHVKTIQNPGKLYIKTSEIYEQRILIQL